MCSTSFAAAGMYALQREDGRGLSSLGFSAWVSIPQAVCTRCNERPLDRWRTCSRRVSIPQAVCMYALQQSTRYEFAPGFWICFNTASGMYALQRFASNRAFSRALTVSIPQAVCTRCNSLKIKTAALQRFRFQYRKRYVRVATYSWPIMAALDSMFQYRKRYYPVATENYSFIKRLQKVSIPQAVMPCCNSTGRNNRTDRHRRVSIPQAVCTRCNEI